MRIGRQFGSYEIKELLGEGGYAHVFRASSCGRVVALKVLKDAYGARSDVRHGFVKEAKLQRNLQHTAIVGCRGIEREGDRMALVLEYFDARSLRAFLEEPRTMGQVLDVIAQVAGALEYLHGRGIAHLDLKPGNILVDGNGAAKLIDFDLAFRPSVRAALARWFWRRPVGGSPSYMAPELIQGRAPTKAADMYALGVITYLALTGRKPFTGATAAEILRKQERMTPQAPSRFNAAITPPLELLVHRLLVKEPRARLSDAGLLLRELRHSGFDPAAPVPAKCAQALP